MTIKEMRKVYKKLEKMEDEFTAAKMELSNISVYGNLEHITEQAKRLAKATTTIAKYAAAMNVDSQLLMENVISEEHFCKWCLINDIEMNTTEETEIETDE